MKLHILGSGAGLPSKTRYTQCIILDCVEEINQYYSIDMCEGMQHQLLHTNIKPGKISKIFITHLHGDHIFGLPGFLSSRVHLGGEGQPLTIYGPTGLADWINITLKTTNTTLNYPLEIIEVHGKETYNLGYFTVHTFPLDHNVESYAYIFVEPDKKGGLQKEKLQHLGIEPGPIYRGIKSNESFQHEGQTYYSKDFMGPDVPGRKIAIHGDTRPIVDESYYELINHSDVIVHESTYLSDEHEKAHQYHHSEINGVLNNLKNIDYRMLIITHISNRYTEDDLLTKQEELPEHIVLANDFDSFTIPRIPRETL